MLHYRSHHQVALQTAPEGERLLLFFANEASGADPAAERQAAARAQESDDGEGEGAAQASAEDPNTEASAEGPDNQTRATEADTPESVQNETNTQVASAMEEPKRKNIDTQKLVDDTRALVIQLQGLIDQMNDAEILKLIPKNQQKGIHESRAFLVQELTTLIGVQKEVQLLADLDYNRCNVTEFFNRSQDLHFRDIHAWEYLYPISQEINEKALREQTGPDDPMMQLELKEKIKGIAAYDQRINDIDLIVSQWQIAIPKMQETLKLMRSSRPNSNAQDRDDPRFSLDFLGTKVFTPNEIIAAIKSVKDAFIKSYDNYKQLRSSGLAQQMGIVRKVWPFAWAQDAQNILDAELAGKDDEAMGAYKKFLETRSIGYAELFDEPGGLLNLNRNDGNRFRAILMYAASRGWLYDFNTSTQTVLGHKLVPGKNLPPTWNTSNVAEFCRVLDDANGNGQGSEEKRGDGRVSTIDNIPDIMNILDDEIKKRNYWAILGIAKQAFGKAKLGYTSAWLTTRILRHLRDDPFMRKWFPVGLLDKLGDNGLTMFGHTGYFKLNRQGLNDFQNGKIAFSEAGVLSLTISRIEKEMLAADPGLASNKAELDKMVAQVLATHEVEAGGKVISIYSDTYKDIRLAYLTAGSAGDPTKADDDYFNPDNDGSELLLTNKVAWSTIMQHSNGSLANSGKTTMFLRLIIKRFDLLKKKGLTHELNNYAREVRSRMDDYARERLNDVRTGTIANLRSPTDGKILYVEMAKRGLISMSVVLSFLDEKGKDFTEPFMQNIVAKNALEPMSALKKMIIEMNAELGPGALEADVMRKREDAKKYITNASKPKIGFVNEQQKEELIDYIPQGIPSRVRRVRRAQESTGGTSAAETHHTIAA